VRVRAYAKINRSLRVLGVRADGYHELRTVFQSIALHDTLTIRAAKGPFRLTCDDPHCPGDETNLVWRAATRLWTASGRRGAPRDISIDLEKRIPLQAGLGGGSSDAAAALRALGRLWRVADTQVRAAGAEVGADVPYFFEGGTALGLERGDLLFPLIDEPPAWVVLVVPGFGVSTKDAFGWFDADGLEREPLRRAARARPPAPSFVEGRASRSNGVVHPQLVNDLEAPVVARHPEIGRIISALRRQGAAGAAMSGSGSAVFGLFTGRAGAVDAARALERRSRRVLVTRTLNRQKYHVLAAM
jgi:4-diphosphocytidyl-2-C-methyl-D-erythritol kinase